MTAPRLRRIACLSASGSESAAFLPGEERLPCVLGQWKEGAVEYLGTTQDVRPHIAAASCVVLPSYREGAPRTLIEAAAMARPLIATDVPGCRAVIDRDITGYLCDVRSAASLAAVIERFLGLSEEARRAMGRAGRAKMEREFDERDVIAAYRQAIAQLAVTLPHLANPA